MTDGGADRLQARVTDLTRALHDMRERLAEERDALRSRAEPDALEALAQAKQAAVEQVSGLYAALREELAAFGNGELGHTVGALRSTHPQLASHVADLTALIRECQQANQDNGLMVSAGLRSANGALDTLTGASTRKPADTYDTQGRTRRGGGSDFLALRA